MALGEIKTARRTIQPRAGLQVTAEAFGGSVARALRGSASTLQQSGQVVADIGFVLQDHVRKKEGFGTKRDFIRMKGELDRSIVDMQQGVERDATGYTRTVDELVNERGQQFLKGIRDPMLRRKYETELESYKQSKASEAFGFEYSQSISAFEFDVNETLNTFATEIYQNPNLYNERMAEITDLIDEADLPELEKEKMVQSASRVLLAGRFQSELMIWRENAGSTGVTDGSDVAMAGLAGWERGLLNAIAGPESGGRYDIRFTQQGGAGFEGFDDHPRIYETRLDGRKSSAAGRYQFVATTWDDVAGTLGIQDFTPESQDKAALFLAERDYRARTGRSLRADLTSGDYERVKAVKEALEPTWEGLQNISATEFFRALTGEAGIAGGPTAPEEAPNPFDDPDYASLTLDQKIALEQQALDMADDSIRQSQERMALQAANEALTVEKGIMNGTLGQAALDSALETNIIKPDRARTLQNILDEQNRLNTTVEEVANKIRTGVPLNTSPSSSDMVGLNAMVKDIIPALQENDQAALTEGLIPLAQRTGVVPTDAVRLLEVKLGSAIVEDQFFAANAAAALLDVNEFALSGMSNEARRVVDYVRQNRAYISPEAMSERVKILTDPAMADARNVLGKQADDALKNLAPGDVADEFESKMLGIGTDVEAPLDGMQRGQLWQDYRRLYRDNYILSQSDGAAKQMTMQQLGRLWGPSAVGGGTRVIKHPPELVPQVPKIGGTLEWVDLQVRSELGWDDDVAFQLVGDATTAKEIARGDPPSYWIVRLDQMEDGTTVPRPVWKPEQEGLRYRYSPQLSEDLGQGRIMRQLEISKALREQLMRRTEGNPDPAVLDKLNDDITNLYQAFRTGIAFDDVPVQVTSRMVDEAGQKPFGTMASPEEIEREVEQYFDGTE